MRALICGVTGQDGAYLARLLCERGYEVHGTSRAAERASLAGLESVGVRGRVSMHSMAPAEFRSVSDTLARVAPDEIYYLAGQSSVAQSFDRPLETMRSLSDGTLNVLEAVRTLGLRARIYGACSSECFGDTGEHAADESTAFRPCSPYGIAKAAAYWHVANYRDAYSMFACSGILFNHESPLRPEGYVTQKIVAAACRIAAGSKETLALGNLDVARDWGWAPEYVEAMWRMLQQSEPRDYVIATGATYPLQAFVERAFEQVGLDWRAHVRIDPGLARPSDLRVSRGNPRRAQAELGWSARSRMPEVVEAMIAASRAVRAAIA
jgi:GDPmannose 4,6-dehydratase